MGGSALGGAIGGDVGSFVGGMAGSIAVSAMMNSVGRAAAEGAPKINLFKRAAQSLVTLPGPVKLVAGLIAVAGVIKLVNDKVKEHEATVSLGFGQTEKTAAKLGLQYKSLSEQLGDFAEKSKVSAANIESTYASIKTAGIPGLTLTIKELKDLKETVKADLPEFVKIFDVAKANEVVQSAEENASSSWSVFPEASNLLNVSIVDEAAVALSFIFENPSLAIADTAWLALLETDIIANIFLLASSTDIPPDTN